jgi:hypothetical protein
LIAPPENQPRRSEERRERTGEIFVFFVSSWLIFILFLRVAVRRGGFFSDIDTTFKRRDHNG